MNKIRLKLPEILDAINEFNESVAKNFYKIDSPSFRLKYCFANDTLHSFQGERCYNCSFMFSPNIFIDQMNFEDFKNYFGGDFLLQIINVIDNWPKKNHFPHTNTDSINSLKEHKRLEGLLYEWKNMSEEDKVNEILDLDSIQKKYAKLQEEIQSKKY